jgi:hypothetical protein
MNATHVLHSAVWDSAVWTLLGLAGGLALLAILSPRLFSSLSSQSSVWIDTYRVTKAFDKRFDISRYVLPYSRLLGAMTLVATGVLAVVASRLGHAGQQIAWPLLGLVGAAGAVAVFSPRLFSRLASWGNRWIDADRVLTKLDRRIDIDRHVLAHCRLFGVAVLGTVVVLACLLMWRA